MYVKYGISGSNGWVGTSGVVGSVGISLDVGMYICCPGSKVLVVRLFSVFIAWTVVENFVAILYKVSPFSTMYVETSG